MKKLLIILFLGLFSLSGCSFNSNSDSNYSDNNTVNNSTNNSTYNTSKVSSNNTTNSIPEPEHKESEEISSFSTKIHDKTSSRQNNIKITISKLNGTTVQPGEEFSFCEIVGKATADKGYEKAKIFDKDGNVTEGYRRR